jgi:hypothetical protein
MSERTDPKKRRIAGALLRAAARLAETPGARGVLYTVATRQLGLDAIHDLTIEPEVVPFRHLHLAAVEPEVDDG